MRHQFVNSLIELAKKDKDIMLLTADVGFSYLEKFRDALPEQFINCGVAEQNMVGVATGLALAGKKPYIYTMVTFLLFRPYEQIRTLCYHDANVKIVGIKGGESYGFLGFTHNIKEDEDIGVMSSLPNIRIHLPETAEEVKKVVLESYKINQPTYIRL